MISMERRRFVILAILSYALFSSAWIVLSDQLLLLMPNPALVTLLSTAKGLIFVFVSALFLAWGMLRIPDRQNVSAFPGLSQDLSYDLGARGWRRDLGNYLLAVLLSGAALGLRLAVPVDFSDRPLLIIFIFPIIVAALLGGAGPGLFSTILMSTVAIVMGKGSSDFASVNLLQWLFLLSGGILVSLLSGSLHRSRMFAQKDRQILSLTLGSLSDGLVAGDRKGLVAYVNPAAEQLLGLAAKDLLGQPLDQVIQLSGEDDAQTLLNVDGQSIPIRPRRATITVADGPALGELVMLVDDRDKLRTEQAIRDERRRLRTLIDSMPDLVWVKDVQGNYLICNPMFERFVGIKEADLVGKSDYDLVSADQADFFRANDRMALSSGASRINTEWLTMASDGRNILVETVKSPVLDKDGQPVAILGVARDITASWQTQQRLTLALSAARMGVWEWNLRSDQVLWSPECSRITGLAPLEMMFEDFRRIIHPDDVSRVVAASRQSLAQGEGFRQEFRILRPDGELRWLSILGTPHYDDSGLPLRLIGTVSDITDQRNTAEELDRYRHHLEEEIAQRSEQLLSAEGRFGMILDSSADGLMGVDTEGYITFVNPASCRILGYDKEQLLWTKGHQLFHYAHADGTSFPEEECPILDAIQSGKEVRQNRDTYWRADGKPVPVASATHPMVHNGAVVGAVVSFSDISSFVAAEDARDKALAEAERLANVRREFLANMSHEIRTPLNAVLGLAHIGNRECAGRKSQVNFQRIIEAGHTLLGIVNDVLDFSKIEAGQMRVEQVPVVLAAVIDQTLMLAAGRAYDKGLLLVVEEDPGLPSALLGDSLRLSQVIGNLLSNAIKFTPGGGLVRLALSRRGKSLEILVADSGIGMSEEQISRLFSPFEQADGSTTRHFGGTGLGLSITRTLLELMGGEIAVKSSLGQGSRFTVTLPLIEVEAPRQVHADGQVALLGLEPDEAETLQAELLRRGVVAIIVSDVTQIASGSMVVTPAKSLAAEAGAALRQALPAGCRLLAVGAHGHDMDWDASLFGVVERPLRARQIIQAMAAPCAALRPVIRSPRRLSGLSFLVAEDNEVNRLVMHEMLEAEGAWVVSAENGSKALDLLTKEGPEHFHMLLTDIQMPDFDGYELARRVSVLAPALPIIGVTAHAMPEERLRCLDAGMVAHVTKPVDPTLLVETVLRHVRAKPVAPEPLEAIGIDWDALEDRYHGKPAFIAKLLSTVEKAHAGTAAELRRLAESQDFEKLAFLAHGMKGSAGNLMADGLRRLAQEAEHAAREGRGDEVVPLAERLALALEDMLDDIRQKQEREQEGAS